MDDVVISVENISKSFGGVNALQQVSMTVRRGEIHCLAGENGSGKSTLIKVISGYYRPDSGTIRIDGRTFTSLTPAESIRHGVQVIYQDFSLFPNLSVMENLALNAEVARGSHLVSYRRMRETAQQAVEKIRPGCGYERPCRRPVCGRPADDCHCACAGAQGQGGHHGRGDRLADPQRSQPPV